MLIKRLLLPLLAALALPTIASAESVQLVLYMRKFGLEKIEMRDLDQCIKNGEAYKDMKAAGLFKNYVCLEGK